MQSVPRQSNPAGCGTPQPFEIIHQIGFSAACIRRLERYRRRQVERGAQVLVLSWPDGTWCVLALHLPPLIAAALTTEQMADAYTEARQMIAGGYLPLLTLRLERYMTH
ncbi:hypothetical protein EGJ86_10375 [Pseudomonas sp. o96-267]|nr:hypothetical protein EGJ86_10375 [Pseudomonas sp. o96-267]